MKFALLSPTSKPSSQFIFYLSGLGCSEQNFIIKSGAARLCEKYAIHFVVPDTSPRHLDYAKGHDLEYGEAASYYIDATEMPYSQNYQMFSYISQELPELCEKNFATKNKAKFSIMGHSMGGHGALVCGARHPQKFKSISALAPVSSLATLKKRATLLERYLGPSKEAWA